MTQTADLPSWPMCGEKFNALYGVTDADWKRGRDVVRDVATITYPDTLPAPASLFSNRAALEASPPPARSDLVSAAEIAALETGTATLAQTQDILARVLRCTCQVPSS